MTAHFDPLEYVQQLETVGVPKAQAEVHARTLAHVVNDCVPHPTDLTAMKNELSHRLVATETQLRSEIKTGQIRLEGGTQASETRILGEVKSIEAKLIQKIAAGGSQLSMQIESMQSRLLIEMRYQRKLHAVMLVLIGAVLAGQIIR